VGAVGVPVKAGETAKTTLPDPVEEIADIDVPLPCKMPVIEVERVIAGVVEALATLPASPLADTTDTEVTDPPPLVPGFAPQGIIGIVYSTFQHILSVVLLADMIYKVFKLQLNEVASPGTSSNPFEVVTPDPPTKTLYELVDKALIIIPLVGTVEVPLI
jgi:hypothetical protein